MAASSLAELMADAARDLRQHDTADLLLQDAVQVAYRDLDPADGVGVSIVHRNEPVDTPASTGVEAQRSDELQYEVGEGPCLSAIWDERTVLSRDLRSDARWPKWGPRMAEETGFRSMVTFQLFAGGDSLGALNVYSSRPDAFTAVDIAYGEALAAHVAVALVAARKIDNLDQAVLSRTNIGIALGIVMERYSLDRDRAFAVLTRIASLTERKLRDIAHDIAAGGELPSTPATNGSLGPSGTGTR